jgi:hypothetical protein
MQTIDIWSFGCVLSMAATWVVFGFQGIRDYEAVRRKATAALRENNEPGPVANDAFHNGNSILPEVVTWHAYLRANMRKHDVTTERVLTLIEKHMLLEDPRIRIDSAMLCSKLAEIVEQSKIDVEARADPMLAIFNDLLANIDAYAMDPDVTSQTVPSHDAVKLAPTNSLFVPSGSSRLPFRTGSPSAKQVKKSQRINAIPRLKTTVRTTRRLGVPSQKLDNTLKPTKQPVPMTAAPNPTLFVTEAPDLLQSSMAETPEEELQGPLLKARSPALMFEPEATVGSEPDRTVALDGLVYRPKDREIASEDFRIANVEPIRPFPSPLQTLELFKDESPIPTPTIARIPDLYSISSKQAANGKAPLDSSESSTLLNPSSTTVSQHTAETRLDPTLSKTNHAVKERTSADHISLRSHRRTMSAQSVATGHGLHSSYPNMDLDIVQVRLELNAKIEKTSHKLRDKLGFAKVDPVLENHIKDRDIAFIVDNGTTMVQHWQNVLFTLETLYLKLDGLDKNGVDLVFTDRGKSNNNKDELKRSSGRTALVRSMNEARPTTPNEFEDRVRTNMREVLSPIFQKFLESHQDKRMTLIVLTDGMWEGNNKEEGVAQKIADFFKRWQNRWGVVEDRWFSIQFVSFGNDETALHRLQVLDDEMEDTYKIP